MRKLIIKSKLSIYVNKKLSDSEENKMSGAVFSSAVWIIFQQTVPEHELFAIYALFWTENL